MNTIIGFVICGPYLLSFLFSKYSYSKIYTVCIFLKNTHIFILALLKDRRFFCVIKGNSQSTKLSFTLHNVLFTCTGFVINNLLRQ